MLLFEDVRAELLNEPGRRKAQDPTPRRLRHHCPTPQSFHRVGRRPHEYELRAKESVNGSRPSGRERTTRGCHDFLGEQRLLSLADRHVERLLCRRAAPHDRQPVASASMGNMLLWSKPSSELQRRPERNLSAPASSRH